jgi:hypothetical protein
MIRIARATIALPLVVLLAGILVPMLIDSTEIGDSEPADRAPALIRGKTGDQWAGTAREARDAGDFRRALYCIKVAERVDPGEQYAEDLSQIRRARWRRREVDSARERLLGAPLGDLTFREDGSLEMGRRTIVALPGESLWSLARALVAAERAVLPEEVDDAKEVYAGWDRLVELNGLRELEVGELVAVPLSDTDVAAIEAGNRADLAGIAEARETLESGDVEGAERLLASVEGAFARSTEAYRQASEALSLARELSLVDRARADIDEAQRLPRATGHTERLALLSDAAEAISQAEDMRGGVQYADALELAQRLSVEERRYDVRSDGTVLAVKPDGKSYVSVARDAVEWLLQRELVDSGSSFPDSHLKSDDERAWVRYLMLARESAESEGSDFAALLTEQREILLHLPEPTAVFAD